MRGTEKKKGTIWMFIGLLLLAAALFLTFYNLMDAKRAEKVSAEEVRQLLEQIDMEKEDFLGNTELYKVYPEMEMPTLEIDGEHYIGVIEIPMLGLQLPVMAGEWSYKKLKIAPCRYAGSIYTDDLIIAAHNYSSHFGLIKNLKTGDEVHFIDADGHVFRYEVGWLETVDGTDSATMLKNEEKWDLTLFTCTYSGSDRYTLRCSRMK